MSESPTKHVDPHFILCRTHNSSDVVALKKKNYAIFMRQEQKRLTVLNRRLLDQRETYKMSRQRKQYDERMKQFQNVTVHLPPIHIKRQRLLQTSADYLDAFAEKAELLLGLSRRQFDEAFMQLPTSQMTAYLPPAFSSEFVKYFQNREHNVFADEEKRLHVSLKLSD
jgi:hypothetical protein